jgi:hypothetical protein
LPPVAFALAPPMQLGTRRSSPAVVRGAKGRWPLGLRLDLLGDEVELAVEAERGVILRRRDLVDGEQATLIEVEEIAFDEEFPAETFAPLPGVEIAPEPRERAVELDDLVGLASFTLLLPRGLGSEWTVGAPYFPGRPDGEAESVVLEIASGAAYYALVFESRERELDWEEFAWEPVERDGRRFGVSPPLQSGSEAAVKFEQAGTRVLLRLSSLDPDALLELAVLLEPISR